MLYRRHLLAAAGLATSALAVGRTAVAQSFPAQGRVIVGFPPGGSLDFVARLLRESMKEQGISLAVDNRAGAGGRIGLEQLKVSRPDGATIAITPGDQLTLFPHIYRTIP